MKNACNIVELFKQNLGLFNALGDRHRQQIILLMSDGEQKSVKEIATYMRLSRPTVSHHIKILKDARLLGERHEGRKTYYFPVYKSHIEPLRKLIFALEQL